MTALYKVRGSWYRRLGAGAAWVVIGISLVTTVFIIRARLFPDASRRFVQPPLTTQASPRSLGLRTSLRNGDLEVTWNHDSADVRNASSGMVTIRDAGANRVIPLSETMVRTGSVMYSPLGTHIKVGLTVMNAGNRLTEEIETGLPLPKTAPKPLPVAVRTVKTTEVTTTEQEAAPPVPLPIDPPAVEPKTADVRVIVDPWGEVVRAELLPQPYIDEEFRNAALDLARHWQFEPPQPGRSGAWAEKILHFQQPAYR